MSSCSKALNYDPPHRLTASPPHRLTASPLGGYTYGDAAHVDAATAIGSAWTASYDAAGDMTCRAATSATTSRGEQPDRGDARLLIEINFIGGFGQFAGSTVASC